MIKKFVSAISGSEFPVSERVEGKGIRKEMLAFIMKQYPNFSVEDNISVSELSQLREDYVTEMLKSESGELSDLESKVIESLKNDTLLSEKIDDDIKNMSFGQKVADKVASFGGSWTFILTFLGLLVI